MNEKSTTTLGVALKLFCLFVVYTVVNGVCLAVPVIPGIGAVLLWGFAFPAVLCGVSWCVVARDRKTVRYWWLLGILATGVSIFLGFFTVASVSFIWAAV